MYKTVTADELQRILESGEKKNIIDVRELEEVQEGKIPGAKHIPLGELENRTNELDSTKEYVIVCHAGGRSQRASEYLASHGYRVHNMLGGMSAWKGETE
ncbi:rhodanese-like domain-containing protein [Bacillus sp. 165]|uniref:rhodanese-like domain-containing protein n=1 Tax=Bacillus sp. 165 TaxID=1529117 RepID=UPI001ADD3F1D|nr:rhodanese-like domain-containing protein [Bacillus sp. 165]MBO9130225.1 rhodanese-like domain-containing protein [Bacillus sp. 165]